MSVVFDPYHEWLGISPREQPPHHYRLLGVRVFENDADAIDRAADARMAQLRAAQIGQRAAESQRLLNEVAAARACLVNPRLRAEYDAELKRRFGEQSIAGPGEPAFSEVDNFEHLSGDLVQLPNLQQTDPIYSVPLPGAYVTPAAAPPHVPSRRRATVNPLIWIVGSVGVFAVLLFVGMLLIVVYSLSFGGSDSDAVASNDIQPLRPNDRPIPNPRPLPTPPRPAPPDVDHIDLDRATPADPTPPVDPVAAAEVDQIIGRDALLQYTFERETFVEEDGKLILEDQSGKGFNGIVQGSPQPEIVPGRTGAGLRFAGRNGQVVIPRFRDELAQDRTEFTVAVWIKPDTDQREVNQPESEIGSGSVFDVGWLGSECINLRVAHEFGFILATRQGGKLIAAPWDGRPEWHHLAAVWDGKEQRLYLDGRLAGAEATTLKSLNRRTLYAPESRARLGITAKSYNDKNRYYHGVMDELVVLSRALTDAEVARLVELQSTE